MANTESLQQQLDRLAKQEALLLQKKKALELRLAAGQSKEVLQLLKEFSISIPQLRELLAKQTETGGDSNG